MIYSCFGSCVAESKYNFWGDPGGNDSHCTSVVLQFYIDGPGCSMFDAGVMIKFVSNSTAKSHLCRYFQFTDLPWEENGIKNGARSLCVLELVHLMVKGENAHFLVPYADDSLWVSQ